MGLRELKKERTRRLIADTAWRLFSERGFDAVTVAEVAREAQVHEATVFNYFPRKEDLFYSGLESYGDQLVDAVRAREPGEPAVHAFRRFMGASDGLLAQIEAGDVEALDRLRTVNRMIAESRSLQAREEQAIGRYTDSLAAVLAAETEATPDDIGPSVAAHAMVGVHRALLAYVRRRVEAGDRLDRLASDARERLDQACALLERGLGDYAIKPG